MTELPPHVLFYDGVCAMCNGIVRILLRIDQHAVFHFAPLQGETAELARTLHPDFPTEVEAVVYLREGEVFVRSRAAALALEQVPYPMKAFSWLRFLPTWLTAGYPMGLPMKWMAKKYRCNTSARLSTWRPGTNWLTASRRRAGSLLSSRTFVSRGKWANKPPCFLWTQKTMH